MKFRGLKVNGTVYRDRRRPTRPSLAGQWRSSFLASGVQEWDVFKKASPTASNFGTSKLEAPLLPTMHMRLSFQKKALMLIWAPLLRRGPLFRGTYSRGKALVKMGGLRAIESMCREMITIRQPEPWWGSGFSTTWWGTLENSPSIGAPGVAIRSEKIRSKAGQKSLRKYFGKFFYKVNIEDTRGHRRSILRLTFQILPSILGTLRASRKRE